MDMNEQPLISIIVPVYNVSDYLDKCIKSIVNQSYRNLEILLIDDGSTDDSGLKCDAWEKRDKRIHVIHKHNGGLSSARNVGLANMTGAYIMFVDSDDFISSNIVSLLYNTCINRNADIAICDVVHVFNELSSDFQEETRVVEFTAEDAICEMWYQTSFLPSAWAKLYKQNLFQSIKFAEGILYEDIDIMHVIFWKAKKIVFTNAKQYGYVHREGSITTKSFSRKDLDILDIVKKMLLFADDKSEKLKCAAESYATSASLRIYLNVPRGETAEYQDALEEVRVILNQLGSKVLKDKNIRKKNKVAILLYLNCKPLLRAIYGRVNRWK